MALVAPVENGKIIKNSSSAEETKSNGNDLGYDQFLQLLCAEMQYQDPLEPTSNTDYVAQMATFSQLESSLAMQEALNSSQETTELGMANNLVGKTVIVKDPESPTGFTNGTVDYVMKKDDDLLLSINDFLSDLFQHVDSIQTMLFYS